MNKQISNFFFKAKLNIAVITAILIFVLLGKVIDPTFIDSVFEIANKLISDFILLFISITLGIFIPQFKWVVIGSVGFFFALFIAIKMNVFNAINFLTIDYGLAVLIVILEFAAVSNLYRSYRELKF